MTGKQYTISIWHDNVWEVIDEHDTRYHSGELKAYRVSNPDGVFIGPTNMSFWEAHSFMQQLRRSTANRY